MADYQYRINAGQTSLAENSGTAFRFSFTYEDNNHGSGVVRWSLRDITTGSADYSGPRSGSFTTGAGGTTSDVVINIVDDGQFEGDETFAIDFENIFGESKTQIFTIVDNDPAPVISIAGPAAVTEGNVGSTVVAFTATRTGDLSQTSTVAYTIANGTADLSDYIASPLTGTLTFGANASQATVSVAVRGDYLIENDETLTVALSAPTNAVVSGTNGTATGTILNDDIAGTVIIGTPSVIEGDTGATSLVYSIARSAGATGDITFTLTTDNGGVADAATAGTDFTATSTDFAYVSGQLFTVDGNGARTPATGFVVPVTGDYAVETDEAVRVVLVAGSNGVAATPAIGTIATDDANYTIGQAAFIEADTGTTSAMTFTVTADRAVPVERTVYLTLGGGTATAGTDYDATARSVTFAANATGAQTFTVPVFGDYAVEGAETFAVNAYRVLTGGVYAQQIGTAFTATITDTPTDIPGSLTIADLSIVEGDAGTRNAVVTVTRTGGRGDFDVRYSTVDGIDVLTGATAGTDYDAVSGILGFRNASQSETILVPIRGDRTLEATDQFSVLLSNAGFPVAQQATLVDDRAVVSIVNDDGGPGVSPGATVTTSSSYIASPDAQVTSIQTANAAGTDPIDLTGNFRDQLITGNNGDNIINGGGGSDTLVGLGGNDTFLVRGPGDVVIEANGGGRDTVFTTVSYNLGVNEVEVLSTVENAATDPINLIGNFTTQLVIGNYGNNILNGGSAGLDTLIGLRGDDLYAVGDSRTVIVENGGEGADTVVASVDYTLGTGISIEVLAAQNRGGTEALTLRGNELAQTVVGNDGANIIDGGAGSDVLVGGGGADRFAFTTALGNGNVDAIVDFTAGTDRIQLSSAIFGAVGTSVTAAGFVTGTAATTADQHIVYNATTGQIFYDADGSGAGAAILFATVAAGTQLSAASFEVAAPTVIG